MIYSILKTVHLGALTLWLGPALGSWLVLIYSQRINGERAESTALIYKVFFVTITLEHIAFVVLLSTGGMMAYMYDMLQYPWLSQKWMLILAIIIPLEIVDVWLGNWKVKKLVEKRISGVELTKREGLYIHHYHTTFTRLALVVLPVVVLLIMWLAVSKNGII